LFFSFHFSSFDHIKYSLSPSIFQGKRAESTPIVSEILLFFKEITGSVFTFRFPPVVFQVTRTLPKLRHPALPDK
jgi:hypothetical protein